MGLKYQNTYLYLHYSRKFSWSKFFYLCFLEGFAPPKRWVFDLYWAKNVCNAGFKMLYSKNHKNWQYQNFLCNKPLNDRKCMSHECWRRQKLLHFSKKNVLLCLEAPLSALKKTNLWQIIVLVFIKVHKCYSFRLLIFLHRNVLILSNYMIFFTVKHFKTSVIQLFYSM